ncbi:MAG TPA: YciI family protein [Steroidobacteraceae bacterium]|jgi:hypothetical protein
MLYAILCYHNQAETTSWSKEKDAAVMSKLAVVQDELRKTHRLGPVARLMPTTAATTLRKDREPALVVDGPFAETKEQLLGFYLVECATREEAVEVAQDLGRANPGGAYELRPVAVFQPNEIPAPR